MIMTFYRIYFNCAISHKVSKVVINLVGVLGARSHFGSARKIQSTIVFLEFSVVNLMYS